MPAAPAALAALRKKPAVDAGIQLQERRPLIHGSSSSGSDSDGDDLERRESSGGAQRARRVSVAAALDALEFGAFQWRATALFSLAQCGFCAWVLLPVFTDPILLASTPLTEDQLPWCTTAFFGGWAFLTPLLSRGADSCGRRRMALLYYSCALALGLRVAFVTDFHALAATRALHGGMVGGCAAVNYVWLSELVPSSAVARATAAIASVFAVGVVVLAAEAYLLLEGGPPSPALTARLGCVSSVLPLAYLVLAARFLPESPAFFVSAGRASRAAEILVGIAEANGKSHALPQRPYLLVDPDQDGGGGGGAKRSGPHPLCAGPLFTQLLALSFTWFAVSRHPG